jgi:hypothetical protein
MQGNFSVDYIVIVGEYPKKLKGGCKERSVAVSLSNCLFATPKKESGP